MPLDPFKLSVYTISTGAKRMVWDPAKAARNLRDHHVSFESAKDVFFDPLARIHDDPAHSSVEHREIIVGHSARGRLLVVSFAERDRSVRIIGARRTTRYEREDYEQS